MNRISVIFLSFIICSSVFASESTLPDNNSPDEIIIENADIGEFLTIEEGDSEMIRLSGRVSMKYGQTHLNADTLVIYTPDNQVEAIGNVLLIEPGRTLSAQRMIYDLKKSKGVLLDHHAQMKPWYLSGEKIEQRNKKLFYMTGTRFTTCDLAVPHYTLRAKKIKVILNDKIIFRNVTAYVGNMPIFYLPYYSRPFGRPRWDTSFGTSRRNGILGRAIYHYSFKPGNAGDAIIDYYSKKGVGLGIKQDLTFTSNHRIFVDGYWIEERSDTYGKRGRARMRSEHKLPFGFTAKSEWHWVSDPEFRRHYFEDEYLSERTPRNFISIDKRTRQFSFSALTSFRLNTFIPTEEHRPEIRYILYPLRLGKTNFYVEGAADYLNIHDRGETEVRHLRTSDMRSKLYSQMRIKRFLSITPFVGYEGHWYDRTPADKRNVYQNLPFYGVDTTLRTRFRFGAPFKGRYRYFKNYADLTFGYEQREALNMRLDEIPPLGRGGSDKEVLKGKLTQYIRGFQYNGTSAHFFNLNVQTEYDLKKDFDRWQPLVINSNFRPVPSIGVFLDMDYDLNKDNMLLFNPGTDFKFGRRLSGKLGYIKRKDNDQKIILKDYRGNLSFDTLDKWKLGWRFEYDAKETVFTEMEYRLTRELHKWVADFRHIWFPSKNEFKFYVSLQLKDIPGAVLGYNTSFKLPGEEKPASLP